jgi:adenine-specific DNA-methyltransferase
MSSLTPTQQKLRGGYYTPVQIADFLTSWAIQSKDNRILEPSCGDGIFLESAYMRLKDLGASNRKALSNIHAVELNRIEYQKTKERMKELVNGDIDNLEIKNDDFFSIFLKGLRNEKFDSIIGNPPFIRYQNFDEKIRERALEILKDAGLEASKLTNIWMPFLVASSLMLTKYGRLAMIVPAELLQVKYAAKLRLFLSEFYSSIIIITFKKLVFPDIQQEIVLFLGEKNNGTHGINIIELDDTAQLEKCLHQLDKKIELKPINHNTDKWIQYFLTNEEILLIRKLRNNGRLTTFGNLAEVDVGVVTGRNEFFVIDDETMIKYSLASNVIPIVSRTVQIQGVVFKKTDWEKNRKDGHNCHLFYPHSKKFESLNKNTQLYVKEGEKNEFHTGYKCRIRNPWYIVPTVWSPHAFLYRQINGNPRLVLNESDATVTDTIHRVRLKDGTDGKSLVTCFHNSLTFAFAEILGRSYGGGVLELEPNEAEELPIPYLKCEKETLHIIDNLVRSKKPIENVLDVTDRLLLKNYLHLSNNEIQTLRNIWKKLSLRRINRKF